MTLGSTCKATLERAMECLPDESKKQVKLFEAKCPIFQGVKSRKLRALMMVALGCDVYKQGIKGVGATTLKRAMDKLGRSVVETLVYGIVYEPTNYVVCNSVEGDTPPMATEAEHTYFGGQPPDELPEYLIDFASTEIMVEDGPSILLCKGVGSSTHIFLARTGWKRCYECNMVVCGLCSSKIEDHHFCLHCFAAESLVPSQDGGFLSRFVT